MDARTSEIAVGEAKARFSELLSRAEHGEVITIKRHGRAVARIIAAVADEDAQKASHHAEFLAWLRSYPAQRLQPGETYKDFIDAGRR